MSIDLDDRGVVVTDASFWVFDGHGRFRRTPRHDVDPPPPLAYAHWEHFALAEFREEDLGCFRLRVVPLGRPPGSSGLVSGTVRWTNLSDGALSAEYFGSAASWFSPSPVPGDHDLWPGELPFTAFGQFGPDALDLRVFDQDVYWVDRNGDPHRIDAMSREYVANVITMLYERAAEFQAANVLRELMQSAGDALVGRVSGCLLVDELGVGSLVDASPLTWLGSTPLLRRLLTVSADPTSPGAA